jgi:regulator of protease activity HflC (stomatin/prohibitin superfamily)
LTDRERAIKAMALVEVRRHLASQSLDDVLSPGRSNPSSDLVGKMQAALNAAGVQVIAVDMPMLRPSGGSAPVFEELGISLQARREHRAIAERDEFKQYTNWLGKAGLANDVLGEIDTFNRLYAEAGSDDPRTIAQRQKVEDLLVQGGGLAAQIIADAEADRWFNLMTERSRNSRLKNELDAYLAAPELYTQRETMKAYRRHMPNLHKYIIAIDPERVNVEMDLKDLNPIFDAPGMTDPAERVEE